MTERGTRELDGAAAPPMANGELVFEQPWQGRVFGVANQLCDSGAYAWSEFQAELIRVIAAAELDPSQPYQYYDHFLKALENLLDGKGLISSGRLAERVRELAERPAGHDHDHDHAHHHHAR